MKKKFKVNIDDKFVDDLNTFESKVSDTFMKSPFDRYPFAVRQAQARGVEYPYTVAELEISGFDVTTIIAGSVSREGFERIRVDGSGKRLLNADKTEHLRYFVPWPDAGVGKKIWEIYTGERAVKNMGNKSSDPVQAPSHYDLPGGIQVIDLIRGESFLRGNALKYIFRAPHKGKELEDMRKAAEYVRWEIERLENG